MKGYSLRQAAKLANLPTMTFAGYRNRGIIELDVADAKGNISLFSEKQIERAKQYRAENPPRSRKKAATTAEQELNFSTPDEFNAVEDDNAETSTGIEQTASMDTPDAYIDSGNSSLQVADEPEEPAAFMLTPEEPPVVESITLADRANRIRSLFTVGRNVVIAIGFELLAAKKEIERGQWSAWLATEFNAEYELTERTAQNYMRLAERYGKAKTFSDLPTSTLIKMLALPAGSEKEFVAEQAALGRPVGKQSAREVQRNVAEFKARTTAAASDNEEISGEHINVGASKIKGIVAVDDGNDIIDVEPLETKNENVFAFEPDDVHEPQVLTAAPSVNDTKPNQSSVESYRLFNSEQIAAVRTLITSSNDLQTVKAIQGVLLELEREISKTVLLAETKIAELSNATI